MRRLWVSVCRLGFSVLVYGLGSKKALLEDFRVSYLSDEVHLVINGFFPSITLKSVCIQREKVHAVNSLKFPLNKTVCLFSRQILNALTCEVLEHQGTFRTPSDQIQFIAQTLKDSKSAC